MGAAVDLRADLWCEQAVGVDLVRKPGREIRHFREHVARDRRDLGKRRIFPLLALALFRLGRHSGEDG